MFLSIKKVVVLFLLFVFFYPLKIYGFEVESIDEKFSPPNKLILGYYDLYPIIYSSKNNFGDEVIGGLHFEILDKIIKNSNFEISYKKYNSFEDVLNALSKEEISFTLNVFKTDEVSENLYFSEKYYSDKTSIISSKYSNFIISDDVKDLISSAAKNSRKIGVIYGIRYSDDILNFELKNSENRSVIMKIKNLDSGIKYIASGEIDALFLPQTVAKYKLDQIKHNHKFNILNLRDEKDISFLFNKNKIDIRILNEFNLALKKFVGTKDYKELIKKTKFK